MNIVSRYQVAGGNIDLVINCLLLLESHYPFRLLSKTEFRLREVLEPRVTLDDNCPQILLPATELKWWKYHLMLQSSHQPYVVVAADKIGVNLSEMTLAVTIVLALAHEWCHFLQDGGEQDVTLRTLADRKANSYLFELEAEDWAWEFVARYGLSLLSARELPPVLRPKFCIDPDQLILDLRLEVR